MIQTIAQWVLIVWAICSIVMTLAILSQHMTHRVDAWLQGTPVSERINWLVLARIQLASPPIVLGLILHGLFHVAVVISVYVFRAEQAVDRIALTLAGAD